MDAPIDGRTNRPAVALILVERRLVQVHPLAPGRRGRVACTKDNHYLHGYNLDPGRAVSVGRMFGLRWALLARKVDPEKYV
jgi:hypothetical protein